MKNCMEKKIYILLICFLCQYITIQDEKDISDDSIISKSHEVLWTILKTSAKLYEELEHTRYTLSSFYNQMLDDLKNGRVLNA